MKKFALFLIALAFMLCDMNAYAVTKAKTSQKTETLEYDVFYHWGIIWKKAGRGELNLYEETTADNSKRVHGQLTGKTLSFIEHIMAVRDTLDCWYSPDYVPIEFCKKTNEGSYKAIERNYYTSVLKEKEKGLVPDNVATTKVDIKRWRNKKGNDNKQFSISEPAYDMLSVFYKVRSLDFSTMKPGTKLTFTVFSGIKMQQMNVKFVEKTTCKLRSGKTYPAYKVELAINTKGEDGAPLHVWLSTDNSHHPISVIINLKRIGAIQCEIVK